MPSSTPPTMIGTVGVRALPLTGGKAKLGLQPPAWQHPSWGGGCCSPSLPSGSPLTPSVNLGPWSWQVVEEEARKPEHQGSFFTYLVSEPRSIGHCPPILAPSTATCRKKSGEGDSRPRLVEGTSEPGGEIIILATIYWVHNQGQILSPVLFIH